MRIVKIPRHDPVRAFIPKGSNTPRVGDKVAMTDKYGDNATYFPIVKITRTHVHVLEKRRISPVSLNRVKRARSIFRDYRDKGRLHKFPIADLELVTPGKWRPKGQ
jgi:hypothetical protein